MGQLASDYRTGGSVSFTPREKYKAPCERPAGSASAQNPEKSGFWS